MIELSTVAAAFSPTTLQLILFPTEHCNFRCTYCYEDFKIGRMSRETIDGIVNLISRRTDLKRLNIMWFGGEPTLALDIVKELSQVFVEYSRKYNFTYHAHMTTNGFRLNPDVFSGLLIDGIKDFQITLDGDQSRHDSTRLHATGEGTFDQIVANLMGMKENGADWSTTIRIHVTPSSIDSTKRLLAFVDDNLLVDQRYNLNIHPVEQLGGPGNDSVETFAKSEETAVLAELYGMVKNKRQKKFYYSCGSYVCYAAKPNSFAIRANGRIAKCTVALARDVNSIGRITKDGELLIDNAKHGEWLKGWTNSDEERLACPAGGIKD